MAAADQRRRTFGSRLLSSFASTSSYHPPPSTDSPRKYNYRKSESTKMRKSISDYVLGSKIGSLFFARLKFCCWTHRRARREHFRACIDQASAGRLGVRRGSRSAVAPRARSGRVVRVVLLVVVVAVVDVRRLAPTFFPAQQPSAVLF